MLFETMALNLLVEDITKNPNSKTCVVYSYDGSGINKVGSYLVQSLTMNGVRISLPTFGVFTGTREILKDLQIATLDILSAASNSECSKEDILKRISFVMSDSTSHKLGVTEAVCEELEVEDVPLTLVCNVYPLMVFDYQIKELCQKIHDCLRDKKLQAWKCGGNNRFVTTLFPSLIKDGNDNSIPQIHLHNRNAIFEDLTGKHF